MYKIYDSDLVEEVADIYIATKGTVRSVSIVVGLSKSTVHLMLTRELPRINISKDKLVQEIITRNSEERATRGGKASQAKKRTVS